MAALAVVPSTTGHQWGSMSIARHQRGDGAGAKQRGPRLPERRGYPFGCGIRFVFAVEMVVLSEAMVCKSGASVEGDWRARVSFGEHQKLA
jgi:hypothetical protein